MEELNMERSKLKLTAEEEKVVVFDEEIPTEKKEKIELSLIGKFFTTNSINVKVMKTVMRSVWQPGKGLVVGELDTNFFVFQFFSAKDRDFVLNKGPWAFDGNILLIKSGRAWSNYQRHTKSFAEFLGSKIGTFAACEEEFMLGADKSLCFQVDVDVCKPLRKGINVKIDGKQLWIFFKFLKLPNFCYGCGRLGHMVKACEVIDPDSPNSAL
ncbi:hypothetical protein Cgig2_015387 [Carnegiea gigantea]|uniref:CCHC-type domain-containing protein n=1 Tax=Carnegiea gigantea TaxID=171969 RepID=A0A9Q1JSW9_9CARY|nr:hypothetical protein Cgig2_015387 [Carnegiea gigantea]